MPPRKFNAADRAIAEEFGRRMFYYESAGEEHASVLRRDPEGYAAAYREYAKFNPPPLGTLPPAHDLDRCVKESEVMLAKDCQSPYDHFVAMSAAIFLRHVATVQASDVSEKMVLASMQHNTKLRKETPYQTDDQPQSRIIPSVILDLMPLDPNRMTASGHVGMAPECPSHVEVDHPIAISTSRTLSWSILDQANPRPVSQVQLNKYKCNVEALQNQIFIANVEGEQELFQVISCTLFGSEKIFYLLFADDDEVIAHPSEVVYDMVASAKHILV